MASIRARRTLRVAIDAQIPGGTSGGVESVIIGLASGLSGLVDGSEEYTFLALAGEDEWLRPYVQGSARIELIHSKSRRRRSRRSRIGAAVPGVATVWRGVRSRRSNVEPPAPSDRLPGPPNSDGTVERLSADVVHLPQQFGFLTEIPTIYHPHDLQHRHLPEFFSADQRERRDVWYRTLCNRAAMVAVASSWTKLDVVHAFGLPADKVRVVPLAPPTAAYRPPTTEDVASAAARLGLPDSFVLYPAQTWPHKNHASLLKALAMLRARDGLRVPLVAPGHQNGHFPALLELAADLGIEDQVHWLGFISPDDLQATYSRARAVIIPSLFEAASAPLWEAFRAGVPAACSDVTSLPEQAGNASLIFDPHDIEAIVSAVARLWVDEDLRLVLRDRGLERVGHLSWERVARTFRAHYRRLGGRPLTEEDRILLDEPAYL